MNAKQYQKEQLTLSLYEEVSTIIFLIIWAGIISYVIEKIPLTKYWLLITISAAIYISYQVALFIFDYLSGYKLEHKYNLSTESFPAWLWRHTKVISLSGIFMGLLIVLLYAAIWNLKFWYIWCWLGWIAMSIIFAQIFPILILPIFYKSTRLENESLLHRFKKLSDGTGISIEGIYSLELSASTKKANAMLTGLGNTRRVILGDTIIESLSEDELEVVFAHELGHHHHKHFFKLLTLNAIFSIILFAIIYLILGKYNSSTTESVRASIAQLPILGLVMSLFSFISRPLLNAISRYFEKQSDTFALKKTKNPEGFISAFEKLADQNLADPNPSKIVVWMYYDHPPIGQRINFAKNFRQ